MFIKVAGVAILLTCFVLLYSYAQQFRSGMDQKNTAGTEEQATDNEDDIGLPTGDDPWVEMDKLVAAYYNKQGVAYKGSVKLIDDNGEREKIMEEHPFAYSFSNGSFHYSLDSMEVISEKDYTVAVDHRSRLVSVSRVRNFKEGSRSTKLFDIEEFRKLMQAQFARAEVTQAGSEKVLTIDSIQHPQIQGYRIYYDPQTHAINKMLIGMIRLSPLEEETQLSDEQENTSQNSEPVTEQTGEERTGDETEIDGYSYYVEINYKETRLLSKDDFKPLLKFIVTDSKSIKLQPAYSSYQLIRMSEPAK